MGDHILVVESGQSDERGMAVMAAAKQAIPNKPIRFVVNSHPHFDHASGLAAAVAEGATILTHNNNEEALERFLSGQRTLTGDSLSKVSNRRTNVVTGVGTRDVRRGTNGKVVELHRIPNEHSDGMFVVYLPAEKVLWSADITAVNPTPAQLGIVKATVAAVAEGSTILTHRNNEPVLERFLAGPRTLIGDSLSKVSNRRKDVVQAVGDREVRKGSNGKVVELHRVPNEHSDGLLAVYLPAEKLLWTADITVVNATPAQLGTLKSAVSAFDRLKLDYNTWLPAHPPNPDKPLTKADVTAAVGAGTK